MSAAKEAISVLIGGGTQSLLMLEEFGKQYKMVIPIYIVSGFIWEPVERYWLRRFHRKIKRQYQSIQEVIEIALPINTVYRRGFWATDGGEVPSSYASESKTELPGRNTLFLSLAGVYSATNGIKELAIGTLATSPFADSSKEFYSQFEELSAMGMRHRLKIVTPLAKLKRFNVIKKASELPLDTTFSCINPKGNKHCGVCHKCGDRQRGFTEAKVKDPTQYEKTL
jgi:7-cyano-7-deazaguanine synthase